MPSLFASKASREFGKSEVTKCNHSNDATRFVALLKLQVGRGLVPHQPCFGVLTACTRESTRSPRLCPPEAGKAEGNGRWDAQGTTPKRIRRGQDGQAPNGWTAGALPSDPQSLYASMISAFVKILFVDRIRLQLAIHGRARDSE